MKKLILISCMTCIHLVAQECTPALDAQRAAALATITNLSNMHQYKALSTFTTMVPNIEKLITSTDIDTLILQIKAHISAWDYAHVSVCGFVSIALLGTNASGTYHDYREREYTKLQEVVAQNALPTAMSALVSTVVGHVALTSFKKILAVRSTIKVLENLKKQLTV